MERRRFLNAGTAPDGVGREPHDAGAVGNRVICEHACIDTIDVHTGGAARYGCSHPRTKGFRPEKVISIVRDDIFILST